MKFECSQKNFNTELQHVFKVTKYISCGKNKFRIDIQLVKAILQKEYNIVVAKEDEKEEKSMFDCLGSRLLCGFSSTEIEDHAVSLYSLSLTSITGYIYIYLCVMFYFSETTEISFYGYSFLFSVVYFFK
jgi:hypothetical protein